MTNQTWRTDDQAAELRALRAENESLRGSLEEWRADLDSLRAENERLLELAGGLAFHGDEPCGPRCLATHREAARTALAKDSTKGSDE